MCKTLLKVKKSYALSCALAMCLGASAQTEIGTAAEFVEQLTADPTGEYVLTADLDFEGVEFTPLNEFSGVLDGNGHVIRNLKFDNSGTPDIGLFKAIRGAEVSKLGIENAYFVGNENVGGLAGHVYGGKVNSVYVASSYIAGRDHVGAIAGDLNSNDGEVSEVTNCLSDATIYSREHQAGGIAGVANGTYLATSIFTGTVKNPGNRACGLISLIDSDGVPSTVTNNVSAAAILDMAGNYGRLMDLNGKNGTWEANYSVTSTLYPTKAYKTDYVWKEGDDEVDHPEIKAAETGIDVSDADARSQAFYEGLTFDFDNEWKFFEGTEGKMYPVLAWIESLPTTFYGVDAANVIYTEGESESFKSFDGIIGSWGQAYSIKITDGADKVDDSLLEDENILYFTDEGGEFLGDKGVNTIGFDVENAEEVADYLVATDNSYTFDVIWTKDGFLEVSTPEEFIAIGNSPSGKFRLTNDIDMKDVEFNGFYNDGTKFSGTLNGDGYVVKNIFAKVSGGNNKGVFGQTSGATFTKIGFDDFVVDASVTGSSHVGFIGEAKKTTFDQVAFVGYVSGNDHVGLVAGDADDCVVTNCYANGEVKAYQQVGGFFGITLGGSSSFTNSYYNGKIDATRRGCAGGFIGLIDVGGSEVSITNSVSIGDIYATSGDWAHAGAFIGMNGAGGDPNAKVTFKGNVSNKAAYIQSEGLWNDGTETWPAFHESLEGGEVEGDYAAAINELQAQDVYDEIGWDFENIWAWDTEGDYKYPILKVLNRALTGVNAVKAEQPVAKKAKGVFDLSGRRINNSKLQKGFYIIDGKKVIVD